VTLAPWSCVYSSVGLFLPWGIIVLFPIQYGLAYDVGILETISRCTILKDSA
jgi:hypothetical protein